MRTWKPNKSQRAEFARKMQDPEYREAYYARKKAREDKRRSGSEYDYTSAGGNYIPTGIQRDAAVKFLEEGNITEDQANSCRMVLSGHDCQTKVHHDHIHRVNELMRHS
jgi:hypothetical protein